MFFTLTALALLSLFLISYTFYSITQERKVISKRINTMNGFVFSLEKDMSRQIYISGYRAILSLESYITESGEFLGDSEDAIYEAIMNGTVNLQEARLMEDYKLENWNTRVLNLYLANQMFWRFRILVPV